MKRPIALALVVCACRPAPTSDPPATSEQTGASTPTEPGPVLQATIPLLSGEAVPLSSFHGKVVVLELSASYRDSWEQAHRHFRALLDEHGEEALAVIAVSMDMQAEAIQSYWERDPPPFVLGWDPQGALAARLGAQRLPTIFVLDRKGRVLLEHGGFEPDTAKKITAAVQRGLTDAQ